MKLGAIFVVAIMALAATGVGYAAWRDTITIEGTVNTGNVDLVVVDYSGTWVYKNLATDEMVVEHAWLSDCTFYYDDPDIFGPDNVPCPLNPDENPYMLVAWAYSEQSHTVLSLVGQGPTYFDDEITMTFKNLFPEVDFVADALFHYEGSVPVKVNYADFIEVLDGDDQWLTALWNLGYITVEAYRCNSEGVKDTEPEPVDVGTQLHYCDYVLLELHIEIPQTWQDESPTDDLMLRDGSFSAMIEVVQWNEYPYTN